ncbi:AAEL015145-PA, partial [Aedes aegypti]
AKRREVLIRARKRAEAAECKSPLRCDPHWWRGVGWVRVLPPAAAASPSSQQSAIVTEIHTSVVNLVWQPTWIAPRGRGGVTSV